jgi:formylglycine-generating enzyme required for sulfatase activity
MAGNAAEWVIDTYDKLSYRSRLKDQVIDPCVVVPGYDFVHRGGSYNDNAPGATTHSGLATTYRNHEGPSFRNNHIGFRVAVSADGSPRPRPK